MRPEVIVHNTVSLDGCVTGFDVDLELHYELAGKVDTQATLIGSGTARAGLELFGEGAAAGMADTAAPPIDPGDARPLWVLLDSQGALAGRLHALWGSGYCRGLLVATSERTPAAYLDHLRQHHVEHHVLGADRVDLGRLLDLLGERHGVRRVLVDAGPTLVGVLLDGELVDRLSLIVAPHLAGTSVVLLGKVRRAGGLALVKAEETRGGCVHLEYRRAAAVPAG